MTEQRYVGGGRYKTDGQDCTACDGDGKRSQFCCPECGGHHFGSSENSVRELIRTCHDQFHKACGFSFHERDDHKFFHKIDKKCTICNGDGIFTSFSGEVTE